MKHSPRRRAFAAVGGLILAAAVAAGWVLAERRGDQLELKRGIEELTGGNVERGERAFASYGCGSCHQVGGVPQAEGMVGPPLDGIASRAIIAGKLGNDPDNLRQWIMNPQSVTPGTAMPNLGVSEADARDITAFLLTRR